MFELVDHCQKAGFDASGYSPAARVVLTAMQHYALIVADNGSGWYFQGTQDERWNDGLLRPVAKPA